MNLHDFYYDLPKELIAQTPLSDRSSSRLMVLDRKTGQVEHKVFTDIVDYLESGDCLVLNETKVLPARLIGEKFDTKAAIEAYFEKSQWKVIPENNWKQAEIPEGAIVVDNHNGTAPGLILEVQGKSVILLPGPPNELIPMFKNDISAYFTRQKQRSNSQDFI